MVIEYRFTNVVVRKCGIEFAICSEFECLFSFWSKIEYGFTAPFNNMRTVKFKAQPTNAFYATVNQMFSGSSQIPTTAERAVIKSLSELCSTI